MSESAKFLAMTCDIEKVTIRDKVNALLTQVLVEHDITLGQLKKGRVTKEVKAAALKMNYGTVLLSNSFLAAYADIPEHRMVKILRHAN